MTTNEIISQLKLLSGNSFAMSLLEQYQRKGSLSQKQWEAAERMIVKRNAPKPTIDVSAIEKMFAVALANGLKRPGFICGDIKLSLAIAPSVNAGAIYVKDRGEYAGKIVNGAFSQVGMTRSDLAELIGTIAADPFGNAIAHGKETGQCACCGRTLSDPESVALGIGPICAKKWGFA